MRYALLIGLLFVSYLRTASALELGRDDDWESEVGAPVVGGVAKVLPDDEEDEPETTSLLSFSGRIDSSYQAGSSLGQGFFLPGIRLSAFGKPERYLDYRLSLGQTREFSTVLLPQLIPVEAFVRISNRDRVSGSGVESNLDWKIGLFAAELNPLWTPDLSDLPTPDYALSHQELFLSRDLGMELRYESPSRGVFAAIGAFNGNGIIGFNTNNAKAFTVALGKQTYVGNWRLTTGAGLYGIFQSTSGNLNYKANGTANVYVDLRAPDDSLRIVLDGSIASFQDATRSILPKGGGLMVNARFTPTLGGFARIEYLSLVPSQSDLTGLFHYQIGPTVRLGDSFQVFILYDYLNEPPRILENTFLLRFRLTI